MNKSNSPALSINLFNQLNSFRGHFSITEFADIVMGLVFLKFMKEESLKNDFFKFDNSIELFGESSSQNYNDQFVCQTLNETFGKIELDNSLLNGVFSSFNFNFESNKIDYLLVIENLIRRISEIDFHEVDFGFFFNDLLNRMLSNTGKGSVSYQSKELSELMLSFMPKRKSLSIYNPFSGLASFGLDLPVDSCYFGQEIDRKIWAFSKLRLLANRVSNKHDIQCVNVLESWVVDRSKIENQYDFIVATPPFNMKLSSFADNWIINEVYSINNNANSIIIDECLKGLKSDGGKSVLAISNSFLFSQNITEKKLKEYLAKNQFIELVISLPSGLLDYTSIPFNLLILSKNSNKVLPTFVDASNCFIEISRNNKILDLEKIYSILNSENEFKKQVEITEIVQNDFNLIPARYLIEDLKLEIESGYKIIKLGDLINSIPRIRAEVDAKGRYIRIRDLSDDKLSYIKTFDNLDEITNPNSGSTNNSLLSENSLLFSLRWKTLKPSFFTSSNSKVYYPPNDILACQVNEKLIDIDYLILELDKEYVLRQVELERKGATIPYISRDKLLSIEIKVPLLLEQQKTDVKLVKEELIKSKLKELGLEERFTQLKNEQIEDLSLKKHNIIQHLNNVQSSIDSLSIFMKTNNGLLDAKSIIYPLLGTTVQKRFELLSESLKEAIYFVDNITNELNFQKAEYLNVSEVINACIEKGIQNDQLFEISFFIDEDSFINEEDSIVPMIKFSKSDFEELYNNILQNAIIHGFVDASKKYIFLIELKYDQELAKVIISFLNNGKPFPKGMAERYQIKGEKAGKTGNKGIGSWKINEISKHFGAEIIAQDLPEEEFPVRIDLLVNNENE